MHQYTEYYRLWHWQTLFFSLGLGTYLVSVALTHGRLFYGKLGITLFVIYFALLFFEGERTEMVTVGFVVLLIRHYFVKPVKLKWLAMWFVLALAVFAALRIVRHAAAFDPGKMKEELEYAREAKILEWYSPFVEMGGSVGTVNLTTHLVPGDQPYWYGRSYVQAIIHIVPCAGPAQWLTWTLYGRQAAGTGFSIAGEGYLNFGIPGVFFHMAFMGFFFRRIYAAFSKNISPARALVFIVFFGIMVIQVRNHTGVVVAPFVRIIVAAWLLKHICGEYDVATDDGQSDPCFE
jgi:hypothetical protein